MDAAGGDRPQEAAYDRQTVAIHSSVTASPPQARGDGDRKGKREATLFPFQKCRPATGSQFHQNVPHRLKGLGPVADFILLLQGQLRHGLSPVGKKKDRVIAEAV